MQRKKPKSLTRLLIRRAALSFLLSGKGVVLFCAGLCLLFFIGVWVSLVAVFGALPVEAKQLGMDRYRNIADRMAVPVEVDAGGDRVHQVSAGLLMALDILTGNQEPARLERAAQLLKPKCEYETLTYEVLDPQTGESRTASCTVLSRELAYDGEYTYRYSVVEGVPRVEAVEWRPDYSALKAAILSITGQQADDAGAAAVAELAKAIDSGRPNLEALLPASMQAFTYTGSALPVEGQITSGYGWRMHPIYGSYEFHAGIDIAASYGTPIRAAARGTVCFAGRYGGYGLCVIVEHGNGIQTLYGHCSQLLVTEGTQVEAGDIIALVGSTGVSTGPHLHFEVRQNGIAVDPRTIKL